MADEKKPAGNQDKRLSGNARIRARKQAEREAAASSGVEATTSGGAKSAASRTLERRAEREHERRRRQLTTTAIVVAVIAVIAVVVIVLRTQPTDAPIPEGTTERYAGITLTRSDEGYPRLGGASAKVQVAEYSSFDCPHCRELHEQIMDDLIERVRTGSVALTFVPLYGTGGITNGQGAARAALCAGEQGKFWELHDVLFNWQGIYGNQAFTDSRLRTGYDKLGLDQGAIGACFNSDSTSNLLNRARTQANGLLNFIGTPTFTINGVVPLDANGVVISGGEAILAAIDAEIERLAEAAPLLEATPEVTAEPTPGAEAEATPEVEITPEAEPAPEATLETAPAAEATAEIEVTPEATEAG